MDALKWLEQAGLHVSAVGENLSVGPTKLITDSIREFIAQHKQDILEQAKQAENVPEPVPFSPPLKVERHRVLPPGYPPLGKWPSEWTDAERAVVRRCFHGPNGIEFMGWDAKKGKHDD